MFAIILLSAVLTALGSLWIDILYSRSDELTFPNDISSRSRFRKHILFAALIFLFNLTDNLWIMTAIYLLMLMTLTDFEQFMLFDAMTIPLAIIGALFALNMNLNLIEHVLAAFIGSGAFFLLAILSKGALGGGDVKLIAALGFWLGFELLNVIIYGTVAGGIAAIILIITKQKDRSSYFAYGPYFALSAIYFLLN